MIRLGFVCIMLCCTPGYTIACTCPELSPQQAYEQADLVFQGTVVGHETNWISGGWKFSFRVDQSWKQTTNELYIVNTPWEKDCGYIFEPGKSYVVFVNRKFTPKTNFCMGNLPLESADEILNMLGQGSLPQRSGMYIQMVWLVSIAGFIGLAFVAFVVLRKKIRFNS